MGQTVGQNRNSLETALSWWKIWIWIIPPDPIGRKGNPPPSDPNPHLKFPKPAKQNKTINGSNRVTLSLFVSQEKGKSRNRYLIFFFLFLFESMSSSSSSAFGFREAEPDGKQFYSRKEKSLGLLCSKYLSILHYSCTESLLSFVFVILSDLFIYFHFFFFWSGSWSYIIEMASNRLDSMMPQAD